MKMDKAVEIKNKVLEMDELKELKEYISGLCRYDRISKQSEKRILDAITTCEARISLYLQDL